MEAVDVVIKSMKPEELWKFTTTPQKDLIGSYHFSLGTWIRNNFELFNENNPLTNDILKNKSGISTDPDDISSFIIETTWNRLQAYYKQYSSIPIELPEDVIIKFLRHINTDENTTQVAAIKSVNEEISNNVSLKEIFEKSKKYPDSGYIFNAMKNFNNDRYLIDFGFCSGGEAGDLGHWTVLFDKNNDIQECKLVGVSIF
jgi:hypothetical protein